MSIYQAVLPQAFPYVAKVGPSTARECIAKLLDSNFALTVNWDGTVNLWLSQASYEYLQEVFPIAVSEL